MDKIKLNIFEIISLSWIAIALSGLFWAVVGFFHIQLVVLDIIALLAIIWYLRQKKILEISPLTRSSKIILGALFAIGILLSLKTTPTIFGGRDEGSYSTAAIMLSQDHKLTHQSQLEKEFFKIYGPGKALNFPGFYYTKDGSLKTQFPVGYISWIAVWYSLFGLDGIKFVNFFPFVTFVFSFYLICKKLFKKYSEKLQATSYKLQATLAFLLFLTSFPLLIFYKFTLSEIFFGALAWFSLYLLLRYFQKKNLAKFFLMAVPLSMMLFSRIEAAAIIFALLLALILKDFNRLRIAKYQLMFVILGIIFIISLTVSPNFFIDSLKNLAEPLLKPENPGGSLVPDDLKNFYLFKVFFNYNILPLLIASIAIIFYLIKDKKYVFLIPFVFFSPTLIYLADANISLDHPWLLRRFLFSIIPLSILYGSLFFLHISEKKLGKMNIKKIVLVFFVLMIIINFSLFFPGGKIKNNLFFFSQNEVLLRETEDISRNFNQNDLVLVSQKSSGNGWSLMSAPLSTIYGEQAVYFFNPNDLEKINEGLFENIYLITSESEENLYANLAKEKISDYQINNNIILPSKDPLSKPETVEFFTKGNIYKLQNIK